MKPSCLLLLSALICSPALATETDFPGLKAIMSEADWQKAHLDRLDPADLQLVNAVFAQYLKSTATPPANSSTVAAVANAAPAEKRSLWSRFGLPKVAEKTTAPAQTMTAKVVSMRGANGFVLDNGQVWTGIDPIRDELAGHEIGIVEGAFGSFLLTVDGQDTGVRVRRVK